MTRPLFFFAISIFQRDDSPNLVSRIGDHRPREVGDLASPEACFG